MISTLKKIIPASIEIPMRDFKNRVYGMTTGRNLYNKLEKLFVSNPEINKLFPYDDLSKHYVYEPARQTIEHPDIYINQVRYYRIYKFLKQNYSEVFNAEISVVDIGDTSGVLLKAIGRKGVSSNINADVIEYIKSTGIEAKIGDLENLSFPDKSFDYSFCFECVEHLNNPIRGLTELSRITKKKIFVSIPYVLKTKIYDKQYWVDLMKKSAEEDGWNEKNVREIDGHKFEFSTNDFKKILSHANLEYIDSFPINYFSELGATTRNFGTYFNFFILKPSAF